MVQEATHTYLPDGRIITTYTTIPDKPNVFATTPAELINMANRGGGVLSEIGKTTVIKPSAEFIKEQPPELTPKLAQGESGYYVQSSTGVYVPVSKGVADLLAANNAKITSSNFAAAAAITSVAPPAAKTFNKITSFTLPQTYTRSTTLEEQLKSNKMYKEISISPESVGWERWSTMENIRTSAVYQTAFMMKKMITWESLFATGGAGISLLAGKYPEYQAWLQGRWLAEQRAETLQMSKFGENLVWRDTMSVDINKQQFMEAKAMEIIPPAAMTIAPAFIGKIFSAGSISIKAAQAWSKIGLVVTGAGVAYGTSEAVAGISEGTPAGYYRAAAGITTAGFSAYGLKQMWAAAFPKKYYLEGYRMEHQMYSGEEETLRGEFTKGYQEIQRYRYGSPAEKIPKQTMADEAVYLKIKGYKINQLVEELGGGETVNEFEYNIKFRIAEREGLLKPLLQNIKEVDVFYPKSLAYAAKGETIRNLGISYYDTNFGKPDIVNEFTFSKTGMSRTINIAEWENSFRSIGSDIPISKVFVKGTGYDIFKDEFRALIRNMVSDKNIVITEAEYHSFFLEPELRKPYTSFAATGKQTPLWKTTGDYYGYAPKQDLFDFLGIKDLTKVGGIAQIDLFEGKTISTDTVLAERLKIYEKPLYDFTYYDKPVPVLANYPPETSLTLIPPTIVGSVNPPVLTGMNLGTLKGEAGLGLKPELKTFTRPKLDIRYETTLKQQPYNQPKLIPELRTEPALELRAEPALSLQPKLQPMLHPKMEMRLEARLQTQLQTQLQLQMKPQLMLWFKEKPTNIFREEEGKDWFRGGRKDIFGIGKKDKLRKERFKIEPKSDWLSRLESEATYGRATNIPKTKLYKQRFKKEFLEHPLGMFAGRMPTQEMIKGEKWIWIK